MLVDYSGTKNEQATNWINSAHGLMTLARYNSILDEAALMGLAGLGDASSATGATSVAGTGASAAVGIAATTGAIAASTAAIAIPVIGVAIAGLIFWLNRKGPTQKIETTKIVNDAEPVLKQNLAAWQSLTPEQKTKSTQQLMLDNFNQVWNRVVQLCSDSKYGDPGQNCVNDRKRGGKWDWFSYYYDPIANDPQVHADTIASSTSNLITSSLNGAMSGSLSSMAIMAVLAIVAIGVMEGVTE